MEPVFDTAVADMVIRGAPTPRGLATLFIDYLGDDLLILKDDITAELHQSLWTRTPLPFFALVYAWQDVAYDKANSATRPRLLHGAQRIAELLGQRYKGLAPMGVSARSRKKKRGDLDPNEVDCSSTLKPRNWLDYIFNRFKNGRTIVDKGIELNDKDANDLDPCVARKVMKVEDTDSECSVLSRRIITKTWTTAYLSAQRSSSSSSDEQQVPTEQQLPAAVAADTSTKTSCRADNSWRALMKH
ncbi:hypothetical protein AB1Y20_001369 [Prymnesium parvum]|uniref:RNA-directed RNA polymerase n=1 Tax=Prymnesium parvum TaxID=97485 RepID=A0AB34KAP1_PRYPA